MRYKAGQMNESLNNLITGIILITPPVLFAITVHEVCHGYVAYLLGDPTAKNQGRLTLNPIKHIDPVGLLVLFLTRMFGWAKPVPVDYRYFKNPRRDMIWVSLAGPASNLMVAVISAVLLRLFGNLLENTYFDPLLKMGAYLVLINIGLAVFNLIPIHPLDGSHILQGLLPLKMAYRYSKLEPYGFIILLVLIVTQVTHVIISPIISLIGVSLLGKYVFLLIR
jgi:Zn-dependent protease